MAVKTVGFKRVINLGNYESATVWAEVEIPEGESPNASVKEAMVKVDGWLDGYQKGAHRNGTGT